MRRVPRSRQGHVTHPCGSTPQCICLCVCDLYASQELSALGLRGWTVRVGELSSGPRRDLAAECTYRPRERVQPLEVSLAMGQFL